MMKNQITFEEFRNEILEDFRLSLIGREVPMYMEEVISVEKGLIMQEAGAELSQLALTKALESNDKMISYIQYYVHGISIGKYALDEVFQFMFNERKRLSTNDLDMKILNDIDELSDMPGQLIALTISDELIKDENYNQIITDLVKKNLPLVISVRLNQFQDTELKSIMEQEGLEVFLANGSDYVDCNRKYSQAVEASRKDRRPKVILLGYTIISSIENDPIIKFKNWIIENNFAEESILNEIIVSVQEKVKLAFTRANEEFKDSQEDDLTNNALSLGQVVFSEQDVFINILETNAQKAVVESGENVQIAYHSTEGFDIIEPEIIYTGDDLTLVTYGKTLPYAKSAIKLLRDYNINVELIQVSTIKPFDSEGVVLKSVAKTRKIFFIDNERSKGVTAFMLQQVVEMQGAYRYLDVAPITGSLQLKPEKYSITEVDFPNEQTQLIFEQVYDIMNQFNPRKFPELY